LRSADLFPLIAGDIHPSQQNLQDQLTLLLVVSIPSSKNIILLAGIHTLQQNSLLLEGIHTSQQ